MIAGCLFRPRASSGHLFTVATAWAFWSCASRRPGGPGTVRWTLQPADLTVTPLGGWWPAPCSVAQSCPALGDPLDCSVPGSSVLLYSWSLLTFTSIESMILSNHLILCCPLFVLSSIVPSIRVFSNESALRISWPKYWSFSFSISASNEYSGLISFRIDQFDLLAVQGTLEWQLLLLTTHSIINTL